MPPKGQKRPRRDALDEAGDIPVDDDEFTRYLNAITDDKHLVFVLETLMNSDVKERDKKNEQVIETVEAMLACASKGNAILPLGDFIEKDVVASLTTLVGSKFVKANLYAAISVANLILELAKINAGRLAFQKTNTKHLLSTLNEQINDEDLQKIIDDATTEIEKLAVIPVSKGGGTRGGKGGRGGSRGSNDGGKGSKDGGKGSLPSGRGGGGGSRGGGNGNRGGLVQDIISSSGGSGSGTKSKKRKITGEDSKNPAEEDTSGGSSDGGGVVPLERPIFPPVRAKHVVEPFLVRRFYLGLVATHERCVDSCADSRHLCEFFSKQLFDNILSPDHHTDAMQLKKREFTVLHEECKRQHLADVEYCNLAFRNLCEFIDKHGKGEEAKDLVLGYNWVWH